MSDCDAITTNKLSPNNRNDAQIIMTTLFLSASAPVLDVFLMEFPMGLSSFPSPSVPRRKSICKRGHTCTQTKVGLPPVVPLTADVGDQLELRGQPLGAAAPRG